MMKLVLQEDGARAEMSVMFVHIMIRIEQNFFLCSAIVSWFVLFTGRLDGRKPFHLFLLCLVLLTTDASDATFLDLPFPFGLGSTWLQLS